MYSRGSKYNTTPLLVSPPVFGSLEYPLFFSPSKSDRTHYYVTIFKTVQSYIKFLSDVIKFIEYVGKMVMGRNITILVLIFVALSGAEDSHDLGVEVKVKAIIGITLPSYNLSILFSLILRQ